jgi:uncharacterized protein with HEPN domain
MPPFLDQSRGARVGPDSDIDVLVDLDPHQPMGLFEYARVKLYIAELLGGSADVVNRQTLKPLLRDAIVPDAVNASQRLSDIVEIGAIRAFTAGMDADAFTRDRRTVYAVTRALEIVSEASRCLPDDFKASSPSIDWPAVAAGNVYRHEYELVDDALVWHTVEHGLDAPAECVCRGTPAGGNGVLKSPSEGSSNWLHNGPELGPG